MTHLTLNPPPVNRAFKHLTNEDYSCLEKGEQIHAIHCRLTREFMNSIRSGQEDLLLLNATPTKENMARCFSIALKYIYQEEE